MDRTKRIKFGAICAKSAKFIKNQPTLVLETGLNWFWQSKPKNVFFFGNSFDLMRNL
jgi:hypothetical protein